MTPAEKFSKKKMAAPRKPLSTRRCRPYNKPVFVCSIRKRRQALHLTVSDVAKGTGMTQACISVVERGANVELRTAFKLATFFGCTVEQLWTPAAAACLAKIRGGR